MKRYLRLVVGFVALWGFSLVRGQSVQVIDSNIYASIGAPAVYNQPINGIPGPWAQELSVPFSTGSNTWDLTSIAIYLQGVAGQASDLSVGIYQSGSNSPATGYGVSYDPTTELAALTGPGSISALASYSFTPSSNVELAANTTYWIVLSPSLAEANDFYWYRGVSVGIEGQSLANINTGYAWSTWNIYTDTNQSLNFVASGTAIPEPSTYAIILGAGALGFAMILRKGPRHESTSL